MSEPKALFIGRFCPPHKGHVWLIRRQLNKGIPCHILIRDTEEEIDAIWREALLSRIFEDEDVTTQIIPDIESVNWGRTPGFRTITHEPPNDIKQISASDIRDALESNDDSWKDAIPQEIHDLLDRLCNSKYYGWSRHKI